MSANSDPLGQLEAYLKRSKVNLIEKGPVRDRFINSVMDRVRAAMPSRPGEVVPQAEPQPKPVNSPPRDPDRVMTIKAKNLEIGPGGSVQMTGTESMRADEEMGRSPFVGGGNGQ